VGGNAGNGAGPLLAAWNHRSTRPTSYSLVQCARAGRMIILSKVGRWYRERLSAAGSPHCADGPSTEARW
jgi:hypothetical protein